jgi:hypothetical protein
MGDTSDTKTREETPTPRTGYKAKHLASLIKIDCLREEYKKLETVAECRGRMITDMTHHLKLLQDTIHVCSRGRLCANRSAEDPVVLTGQQQQTVCKEIITSAAVYLRYLYEKATLHTEVCDEMSVIQVPNNDLLLERSNYTLPSTLTEMLDDIGDQVLEMEKVFDEDEGTIPLPLRAIPVDE